MRAVRRSLAAQETDYELIALLVSLGAFAGLAFWLWSGLPLPACNFRALTGLPCVTCGATRAAWQFFHGHFAASFRFNPLASCAYCGIVVFDLYALAVLVTRAPRLRFIDFTHSEKFFLRWSVLLLLAANWAYLLTAHIV